jgi:hypothetical protein
MTQASSNLWPVNQAALKWLNEAKTLPEPDASYLAQLAFWGLERGGVEVPRPTAPSQPSPHDVMLLVETLYGMDADKASRFILSNPNLAVDEQTRCLEKQLNAAESPQDAAQIVIETVYDLMVADSPTDP